jgi:molecular chaperone GrpE
MEKNKEELISQIGYNVECGNPDTYVEECEKILDEYVEEIVKDRTLRTLAEFDNYKKRTEKDIKDLSQSVKFNTLSKFIEILDDWKFFEEVVEKSTNNDIKTGFDLIDKKIITYLNDMGIKEVPTDILFNEDLHEAITMMDEGKEKGTILKVVSNGYMVNGKIIKYPKVIVQS